jgi:immunity protein 27 of polymorphic toxin system
LSELKDRSELTGSWIIKDGHLIEDETSRLIEYLIQEKLQRIAVNSDGWEILYQDPQDQRFWELNFPKGEMQGGGPRTLRIISEEAAKLKFDL